MKAKMTKLCLLFILLCYAPFPYFIHAATKLTFFTYMNIGK